MGFIELAPKRLDFKPFELIGERWMLISAGTPEKHNAMTASWGGLGVIWGVPAATCYVRPQRYTHEFTQREDVFSLCFFAEGQYREELALCGSKSGRDLDKIAECGFTPLFDESGAPYFAEAETVFICRKMYASPIVPEGFCSEKPLVHYPERDFHTMYIGEILKAYRRED